MRPAASGLGAQGTPATLPWRPAPGPVGITVRGRHLPSPWCLAVQNMPRKRPNWSVCNLACSAASARTTYLDLEAPSQAQRGAIVHIAVVSQIFRSCVAVVSQLYRTSIAVFSQLYRSFIARPSQQYRRCLKKFIWPTGCAAPLKLSPMSLDSSDYRGLTTVFGAAFDGAPRDPNKGFVIIPHSITVPGLSKVIFIRAPRALGRSQ